MALSAEAPRRPVNKAKDNLTSEQGTQLDQMIKPVRTGPLRNLRHGHIHHSPGYQWWYGQAALDGVCCASNQSCPGFRACQL
jgi:hypothetical protein